MHSLSDPLQLGNCQLQHRIFMAPMTRLRADDNSVPQQLMLEYYRQRAVVPGTLLITESSFISASSRGRDLNAPGIFTDEQVSHWAPICAGVHEQGSFIFAQLWHVGRAARQHVLDAQGLEMVSSSDVPISSGGEHSTPRPMTEREIQECIADFAGAAARAVVAGFDGVEIHGANGYLVDQFTQDTCNRRTDGWGGSVENRSRFGFEIAQAVSKRIGPERTGIRLSPFSDFQGMGMRDPVPQFTDLITKLSALKLAYLHLVEPRVSGNVDREVQHSDKLDFAFKAWNNAGPVLLAGGFTPESAKRRVEETPQGQDVVIGFGRPFTSNPDLPFRVLHDLPLTPYHRETFYKAKSPDGYTTYPTYQSAMGSVA